MRTSFRAFFAIGLWLLLGITPGGVNAGITLPHTFSGASDDGGYPYGSLIRDGATLYGMAELGGTDGGGVVFKIKRDGTGFQLLHEFSGGANDGSEPTGSLIQDGSTLYGMTAFGGDDEDDLGVIFKINKDGTGFELLHKFSGGGDDGRRPYGSLIQDGSTLYGMTAEGGDDNQGVIFKINKGGTGFDLLHEFSGEANDGSTPYGSLIQDGLVLFGMTGWGGDDDWGVIFKINKNGTEFQLLHEFSAETDDGGGPYGSLTQEGSALYGMTGWGGDDNWGVIFKINTDGTGFQLLHEFSGGANDGREPQYGVLLASGTVLYGMTALGGAHGHGVVFRINKDGSGFRLLHAFSGGANDGKNPLGALIRDGSAVYGMTHHGGAADAGVIFALRVPGVPIGAMMELLLN